LLYDKANGVLGSVDSLMIDLRLNPKRYVHFSLF
jgi:phospholipid/cholesterol/gamma-HCH transport system substrate-binding protein